MMSQHLPGWALKEDTGLLTTAQGSSLLSLSAHTQPICLTHTETVIFETSFYCHGCSLKLVFNFLECVWKSGFQISQILLAHLKC